MSPLSYRMVWLTAIILMLSSCSQHNEPSRSDEMASRGIYAAALSEDGRYSVIGSIFQGGSFWRNTDHERFFNWNHSQDPDDRIITSTAIDASNRRALTTDTSTLVLWDINTGEASRYWTSPAEILDSQLNNGGRYALLGLADHSAVMFDVVRGGITRTFHHKGRVRSVDISGGSNGNPSLVITGSEDQTATIWQVSDGERLFTVQHEEDVQLVKLSHDSRYALTSAQYDRAELWDTSTQTSLGVIPLKKAQLQRGLRITSARFNRGGTEILLGYANRNIELRDLQSLSVLKKWTLPKRNQWQPTAAAVIDVAFDNKQGQYRAISSDGFIHTLN